ncbi:MAG: hypothetical protein ACLUNZ_12875 [Evtepia sp.]
MPTSELADNETVTEEQRRVFARLIDQTASLTEVQGALLTLMQMMQAKYGKPVILLLDEYDVLSGQSQQQWVLHGDAGSDQTTDEHCPER